MIICLYFSYRIVGTYTIAILTLKRALMVGFILDFNRMSGAKYEAIKIPTNLNSRFRILQVIRTL